MNAESRRPSEATGSQKSTAADQASITEPTDTNVLATLWRALATDAPYVGRPFIYEWDVAVDEYGRSIAGEARAVFVDDWLMP